MTRALGISLLPALFASTLLAPTPAAAGQAERAVASCRAEMLSRFEPDSVRFHRIGAISPSARGTRVTLYVTADRRYRFDCAADSEGRIVTASFDPARSGSERLAAGRR